MGQRRGSGHQGTCIKDVWTKTMVGAKIECGRWGWEGWGTIMEGKWGQL